MSLTSYLLEALKAKRDKRWLADLAGSSPTESMVLWHTSIDYYPYEHSDMIPAGVRLVTDRNFIFLLDCNSTRKMIQIARGEWLKLQQDI